jgi:hypothetical protein
MRVGIGCRITGARALVMGGVRSVATG